MREKINLKSKDYVHIADPGKLVLKGISDIETENFKQTWNNLPPDKYVMGVSIRQRRICKFIIKNNGEITLLNDCSFIQSKQVNKLIGGIERHYSQSEDKVLKSKILLNLLAYQKGILEEQGFYGTWLVTCHQIRVRCDSDSVGLATPEGIHSDGHDFVFQHFIQKNNIKGGSSKIYSLNKKTEESYDLSHFLEMIFINDRVVKHDVTPFTLNDNINEGYRDMLIVDFDGY